MADLVITAANVLPGAGASLQRGIAGAAITAGQLVYLNSDGTYHPCDATSAAKADCAGIAAGAAAAGQYFVFYGSGNVVLGAGLLTVGKTYVVSATAGVGAIAPDSDLTTGDQVTTLGIAVTTSTLLLQINATGLAHG